MSTESSDLVAIRRLVADAVRLQNDIEGLMALHTAEVNIVNFGGRRVSGRAALTAAMRQALASPLADVTTTAEIQDVHFVRADVAIVACLKQVFDGRPNVGAEDSATPALPASSGQLTYVLVKEDDDWRIASAQTTPILG
ncbi:SgcJ/EcaC family oxidoreductase (plasmid) [Embleya sp. NBC_00888]|uniref:YybH family protein n=1 Tax=Embleya sp. NBC_00888 TaxID=2975960 RepID=UPI002F90928C|nr:SgcJ/EcaC family oxidoreductase [Embleya sp. NBC_00888]